MAATTDLVKDLKNTYLLAQEAYCRRVQDQHNNVADELFRLIFAEIAKTVKSTGARPTFTVTLKPSHYSLLPKIDVVKPYLGGVFTLTSEESYGTAWWRLLKAKTEGIAGLTLSKFTETSGRVTLKVHGSFNSRLMTAHSQEPEVKEVQQLMYTALWDLQQALAHHAIEYLTSKAAVSKREIELSLSSNRLNRLARGLFHNELEASETFFRKQGIPEGVHITFPKNKVMTLSFPSPSAKQWQHAVDRPRVEASVDSLQNRYVSYWAREAKAMIERKASSNKHEVQKLFARILNQAAQGKRHFSGESIGSSHSLLVPQDALEALGLELPKCVGERLSELGISTNNEHRYINSLDLKYLSDAQAQVPQLCEAQRLYQHAADKGPQLIKKAIEEELPTLFKAAEQQKRSHSFQPGDQANTKAERLRLRKLTRNLLSSHSQLEQFRKQHFPQYQLKWEPSGFWHAWSNSKLVISY